MPKLTDDEVATFLDEPGHLVRVATVDADGMPRNVPIWFIHHEGMVVFTPPRPLGVPRQPPAATLASG